MKTKIKKCLYGVVCFFLVLCSWEVSAQDATSGERQGAQRQVKGGVYTFYALDPLSRALCFRDGREGFRFANNRWDNRCSDLIFALDSNGTFVTATEANRIGAIIDLGTALELRDRYGFEDADNGGEGFASLRLQGDTVVILKVDNPHEKLQPLKEGAALFGELRRSATAPVRLGHIYLIRLTDKQDKSFQHFVKLMVVEYRPNESVTIRWEPL